MVEGLMTVAPNGLVPQFDDFLEPYRLGETVKVKITKARNPKFFRKWWTLVQYAFEHWEPEPFAEFRGITPEKNKEQFRKNLIIMAGHYDVVGNVDGSTTVVAKSIAWANMDEEQFEELYSATVNVVLQRILVNYTRDDLDQVVENLLLGWG